MAEHEDFAAVLASSSVQAAMKRHGLDRSEIYGAGGYRESRVFNGGLKIWKDDWTIRLPAPGIDGVNVHFESRRPGEIQIDVEVFPYEGSIEKDAARLAELKRHIEIKTQLITSIRNKATAQTEWHDLGVTTSHLNRPEIVSTICAVKFKKSGVTASTNGDANFIAIAIDRVTPVVDQIVRQVSCS
jgi:hypothetical protein